MKKLAFVFAAIVAVSFASCGNKTNGTATECDSVCEETTCVDTTACTGECDSCTNACCDSIACDSVVAE